MRGNSSDWSELVKPITPGGHAGMPRFYFDLSYNGEVYHDALGTSLRNSIQAQHRGFEIVRRFKDLRSVQAEITNLLCTIRDSSGRQLMQIKLASGTPVIGLAERLSDVPLSEASVLAD